MGLLDQARGVGHGSAAFDEQPDMTSCRQQGGENDEKSAARLHSCIVEGPRASCSGEAGVNCHTGSVLLGAWPVTSSFAHGAGSNSGDAAGCWPRWSPRCVICTTVSDPDPPACRKPVRRLSSGRRAGGNLVGYRDGVLAWRRPQTAARRKPAIKRIKAVVPQARGPGGLRLARRPRTPPAAWLPDRG